MGQFLAFNGIMGVSKEVFLKTMESYTSSRGGHFKKLEEKAVLGANTAITFGGEAKNNICLSYPEGFYEETDLAIHLSKELDKPVFVFKIEDSSFWHYYLYVKGELVDEFNPKPNHWGEVSAKERKKVAGNASLVAKELGIDQAKFECYLNEWENDGGFAYEEDNAPYGDCKQLSDFMTAIGLQYPWDKDEKALGDNYDLFTQLDIVGGDTVLYPPEPKKKRPWWKFWGKD